MAVCSLRTLLLIVCILELIITVQRQVFDFMGYMWLPIIANFVNILLIIFGSFGAVQYITKYLLAYAIWSFMWLTWNIFLICYFLNLGTLNRESGLLSLGTGSISWWEGNGWGCQPVWGELDGPGSWRPMKVEGCFVQWNYVELGQSCLAAVLTLFALPLALLLSFKSFKKAKPTGKGTLPRPVYTIELNTAETNISESSVKPMTPRRVKRRSGSRGTGSSRRSRRSYRNAGYTASTSSLPRDMRPSRPTSAHSSYSNFHPSRPASYHTSDKYSTQQEGYQAADKYSSSQQEGYQAADKYSSSQQEGYHAADKYSSSQQEGYQAADKYSSSQQEGYHAADKYSSSQQEGYHAADKYSSSQQEGYHGADKYSSSQQDGYQDPPPPPPPMTNVVPIMTNVAEYENIGRAVGSPGYDVVGPYNRPTGNEVRHNDVGYDAGPTRYEVREDMSTGYGPPSGYGCVGTRWEAPPPPAPPYSARATPQSPGPPAYLI